MAPPTSPSMTASVLWSLCRTWGGRLAGFVIYFQLARLLTPAEMGLFSAAFALLVLSDIVADQGMVQAVVQRREVGPAQLSAVLLANGITGAALAVLLWLAGGPVERWMALPGLAPVLQAAGLTLLFSAGGYSQEAWARRELRFRLLALRTLVSTIASGALGVALAAMGYGVWALVAQLLLAAVLNLLLLWTSADRHRLARPDWTALPGLFRFGSRVTGMRLLEYGGTRGVELLIAAKLGAAALGLYAVGTKIHYICLQLLGAALVDVAQSGFARLAAEPARLRQSYLDAVGHVALAATPAWIVLAAAAPEACAIAFGPGWADSAAVLTPFALLGALQVLQQFDTAALNAAGRPGSSMLLGGVRAAVALACVLAVHDRGLAAVAWTYAVSQALLTPLSLWRVRRVIGAEPVDWLRQVWPPLLAALAAWSAGSAWRAWEAMAAWPAPARLFCLGAISIGVYGLVLAAVARPRIGALVQAARARQP
ncbi:Membrane protein involved in the export of O-antigen and teichoic acid [Noviherbaspirillum humi]|uniref:Membrane protein involved in the export of O-antigen and teichoic acid n=1 Tax=Noviherbaspirillum humi TaxID=1688639 RepID=A0A239C4B3_9BURK|nr:oligosaccharide flippase family protein [Noviherbaspirillum humi]SNS14481.1 Membrane protein involved in the export of O-antigen and teichoic acid [Noviherbaspirillum humi]